MLYSTTLKCLGVILFVNSIIILFWWHYCWSLFCNRHLYFVTWPLKRRQKLTDFY